MSRSRLSGRIERLIAHNLTAARARYATNGNSNWTNLETFPNDVVAVVSLMEAGSIRVLFLIETCPVRNYSKADGRVGRDQLELLNGALK